VSESLGLTIVRLRQKARLTQKEAAAAVGVSDRQWQRYEWSETPPSLDMLAKMAELFGVKQADLL